MQVNIKDVLGVIKEMSIKKIIVVFICAYPIFTAIYFKDELKLMFTNNEQVVRVEVDDVKSIIEQTHKIKDIFNSASVSVWIYQPKGDEKAYKERVCYAGDSRNLFYELKEVKLIHHSKILNPLNNNTYIKVTKESDYALAKLLHAYNVDVLYLIPIKNDYGLLVAELMVVFDKEINNDELKSLINSAELIRLSI